MAGDADDPIIALLLAEGLTGEYLRVHVDDGSGHCAGCTWQERARPVHPCALRGYAERAQATLRQR